MTDSVLLRVCATYCHPEADQDAYDSLRRLAVRPGDREMALFKAELCRALTDPDQVPPSLYTAVRYDDGSAERFLRRLWGDLYPDEPVPNPPGR
ncbi:hypothetical protein [Streptosporangium sp. NPDC000239]|uniref:hypothetical protein n=1 Tax=unclassified Streptosporangium TaxID=2632669 RepID=UPI003324EF07